MATFAPRRRGCMDDCPAGPPAVGSDAATQRLTAVDVVGGFRSRNPRVFGHPGQHHYFVFRSAEGKKSLAKTKTGHAKKDEDVDISVVEGALVLTPRRPPHCRLEELLQGITGDNLHGEADFGPPVGNEAL